MAGRPKYNNDLVLLDQIGEDAVAERLEAGQSLATICQDLGVGKRALNAWLDKPERAGLVSRTRARAADRMVTEIIEIADAATPETVNVARLQMDGRKWVASKWNSAAYGDTKGPQVVVNIGDLHLRALRQSPTITIEATPVEQDCIDIDPYNPDA
jgi:transposase-like protein